MLEQLQRLKTHLDALNKRLEKVENENASLLDAQARSETQFRDQILQKDESIKQKQLKVDQLNQQLDQAQTQFKQLNTDSTALAERYSRLEKSCTDLKNRFQEILTERNELRAVKEKMLGERKKAQQHIEDLQSERGRLIEKNDHAKVKVEAIIQRLAILGTEQDQHAQEIQQLAHPTEHNEEI